MLDFVSNISANIGVLPTAGDGEAAVAVAVAMRIWPGKLKLQSQDLAGEAPNLGLFQNSSRCRTQKKIPPKM